MKLSSKVVGCVKETAFVRSDGNLLFASGNEIIITGGENGDQLLFQKIPDGNISSMSASVSEPLLAVGSETGIKIFRVIRSQLSCLSISRIMNTTAKERIDILLKIISTFMVPRLTILAKLTLQQFWYRNKVGCVFQMVIVSLMPYAGFGPRRRTPLYFLQKWL